MIRIRLSEPKQKNRGTLLAKATGRKILQFILDLVDFIRSTPSVIFSMTLEENLTLGTTVTFWILVFLPVVILPIMLLVLSVLGIRVCSFNGIPIPC